MRFKIKVDFTLKRDPPVTKSQGIGTNPGRQGSKGPVLRELTTISSLDWSLLAPPHRFMTLHIHQVRSALTPKIASGIMQTISPSYACIRRLALWPSVRGHK